METKENNDINALNEYKKYFVKLQNQAMSVLKEWQGISISDVYTPKYSTDILILSITTYNLKIIEDINWLNSHTLSHHKPVHIQNIINSICVNELTMLRILTDHLHDLIKKIEQAITNKDDDHFTLLRQCDFLKNTTTKDDFLHRPNDIYDAINYARSNESQGGCFTMFRRLFCNKNHIPSLDDTYGPKVFRL